MLVRRSFTPVDQAFAGSFDRTFQQLVNGFYTSSARRSPVVQATTDEGSVILTVDLPGVPAEAIDVQVAGRTLTLKAEHDGLSWERSTRLGTQFDLDSVVANYANGRLTVTVSTAPEPEARKVAVTVGAPAHDVDAPVEVTSEVTEPVEA
jgi:HSP20 family molecular chaperone IbpA